MVRQGLDWMEKRSDRGDTVVLNWEGLGKATDVSTQMARKAKGWRMKLCLAVSSSLL